MKNQIIAACFLMAGLISVCSIAPEAQASDYKLDKQNKVCLEYLYQWKAGNPSKYLIARNECNRYGTLIMQENMDYDKKEWLTQNVWLIKRGEWLEQRQNGGQYVPREAVTAYFAILLLDEGIDIFRNQEIVGEALHYEDVKFNSFAF